MGINSARSGASSTARIRDTRGTGGQNNDNPERQSPRLSVGSSRSVRSARAMSEGRFDSARNDPPLTDPSRWVRQFRGDPEFQWRRYGTHNSNYGVGVMKDPYNPQPHREPFKGREIWFHNTRQHLSRDNPLGTNHNILPMLRTARGEAERWGV